MAKAFQHCPLSVWTSTCQFLGANLPFDQSNMSLHFLSRWIFRSDSTAQGNLSLAGRSCTMPFSTFNPLLRPARLRRRFARDTWPSRIRGQQHLPRLVDSFDAYCHHPGFTASASAIHIQDIGYVAETLAASSATDDQDGIAAPACCSSSSRPPTRRR